ncbi:hypothetical protein [Falsirhodobacter sp. 1013]|uniref:hypothetical protein n=1 Tax=Falsirhodobacter sp. 1013 TaxID=3417566 RepID=UPI003EB7FE43
MTWWVGTKDAIVAAETLAAREVVGQPEYLDGQEVPPEDRKTERWAIPLESADGRWAIQAYAELTPEGVEVVDAVDRPEADVE